MLQPTRPPLSSASELLDTNREYYDSLWSGARLVEPRLFNTWPLVQSLLPECPARLEVAPGLRPRLPLEATQFVDISASAVAKLRASGACAVVGEVTSLPYADAAFDLVCALDIVEHVEDESAALGELSRVARPGGVVLVSVPLHPDRWTAFDDFVGHWRRYEPGRLAATFAPHGLRIERSAVYGSSRAPRDWSISECGGSPISASAPCGGTTACSCRSDCASRSSCASVTV